MIAEEVFLHYFGSVTTRAIVTISVAGLLSRLVAMMIRHRKQRGADYEERTHTGLSAELDKRSY